MYAAKEHTKLERRFLEAGKILNVDEEKPEQNCTPEEHRLLMMLEKMIFDTQVKVHVIIQLDVLILLEVV